MTGVAQTKVWRIVHRDGFYLYHLQIVQNLLLGDYASILLFCEQLELWPQILLDVLFTDQA
jgi:hypothetical protein